MTKLASPSTLARPFCSVKSLINSQLPLFSNSMIHHKDPLSPPRIIVSYKSNVRSRPYGVSRSRRAITSSLFISKYDHIRECLDRVLGLTTAQREVALRLLRLWAYYGKVYPKEAQITEDPGCSKATYWRTVKLLRELGLLQVVNRYIIRPHAQISNLYRLDRLAVILARYLAEHGTAFWEKWLAPALAMSGQQFWSCLSRNPGDRAGPGPPVLEGP